MKFKFSIPKFNAIRRISIIQMLFPQEKIGGLGISDEYLSLLFLKKKKEDGYDVETYAEEKLPYGVVVKGVPVKIHELTEALKKLLLNAKPKPPEKNELIIALPEEVIFAQPFFVPPNFDEESFSEFMQTNISRIIPFEPSKVYADWHEVKDIGGQKLKLVASGAKSVIDRYREAFLFAGITNIAVEPISLALGRALSLPEGYAIVFFPRNDRVLASVFVDRQLYFYSIGGLKDPLILAQSIHQTAKRLRDFIISELGENKMAYLLLQDLGKELEDSLNEKAKEDGGLVFTRAEFKPLSKPLNFNFTTNFAASYGAGIRGLMLRSEDTTVSILPVGTELEYIKKKRKLFVSAIKKTSYSIMGMGIALFIGLNVFLGIVLDSESNRLAAKNLIALPQDLPQIEDQARSFNAEVNKISAIYAKVYSPLIVLNAIKELQLPGITLTKLSAQNSATPLVNLSGVAATRESLILLRDRLEQDRRFSGAQIPAQAFVARSNISFNLTFTYSP